MPGQAVVDLRSGWIDSPDAMAQSAAGRLVTGTVRTSDKFYDFLSGSIVCDRSFRWRWKYWDPHMADEIVGQRGHDTRERRYHFDLVRNGTVIRDPGGLVLRDDKQAIAVGEKLARKLLIRRSELRGRHCSIRVCNEMGLELALVEVDVS